MCIVPFRSYKLLIIAVSTTNIVSITVVVGLELENNVIVTNIGNSYDRRHEYADVSMKYTYSRLKTINQYISNRFETKLFK